MAALAPYCRMPAIRRLGQEHPQRLRYLWRLVRDLSVSESHHLITLQLQRDIARAIVLERQTAAVKAVAIRLDDEFLVSPGEVDNEGTDPDVHLWRRQAMVAAEAKEEMLQLASGLWFGADTRREAQNLGLTDCAGHLVRRRDPTQGSQPASGQGCREAGAT